ncbi:hypothetical protein LPJ61_001568 [Coemansia biformis]|uniref:Uncharacterized protein n=1 Tax=Coemansia biformis TaxID=1286918 RepID=A0A9W7YE31_9FUNG|nr:hypothetical protein LPJ61_001568 [Coemansia biformis]
MLTRTAPRIPSTLRRAIDVADFPADGDFESGPEHRSEGSRHTELAAATQRAVDDVHCQPARALSAGRPASDVGCQSYQLAIEGYALRPRPHSTSGMHGGSYRLSIVTANQEYKEFSHKTKADVVVQPSKLRGWLLRCAGQLKVGSA